MASELFLFGFMTFVIMNCSHGSTIITPCQSAPCQKLASKILASMNRQVSPCDDFYEYSCSNLKLKGGVTSNDPTKGIEIELNQELIGLLNQDKKPKESLAVHKAKDTFAACMNSKEREKRGNVDLLNTLNQLGGWPILDSNLDDFSSTTGWEVMAGKLRRLGYSLLVKLNVNVDPANPNRHIVALDSIDAKNPLPDAETFFIYLSVTAAHSKFLQGVVNLLGSNVTDMCKDDIKDMLRFQIRLDRIITPNHVNKDGSYDVMTIGTLNSLTKNRVDWLELFNVIFEDIKTFGPADQVLVLDKTYINKLVELLSTTNLRVIHNYLLWRVIRDVAEDGDSHMVALLTDVLQNGAKQKYLLTHYCLFQTRNRSETCVNEVKGFMSYAVTNLYVKNFNSMKILPKAAQIIFNVKKSFEDVIDQNAWMDSSTKNQAKEKLRIMAVKTGYPSWVLSSDELNMFYENVDVSQESHFSNILNLSLFYTLQELDQITKVPDRMSWAISPLTANAFYHRTLNTIYIPLPMLRPPFFHSDWPMAALFGSIGAVAGHEITHGLDDGNSLNSVNGTFLKWWSPTSTQRYQLKTDCVTAKYNNFCSMLSEPAKNSRGLTEPEKICVNGKRTLRENIADIGGVKAAFQALQNWATNHLNETTLPNMPANFTLNHLFYASNAQIWCSNPEPAVFRQQIMTSTNSPNKFRLLGSLSDSKGFDATFSCIAKRDVSPLDQDQCDIW